MTTARTTRIVELSSGGTIARLVASLNKTFPDAKPHLSLEIFEIDQEFEPGVIYKGAQLHLGHQEVVALHALLKETIK